MGYRSAVPLRRAVFVLFACLLAVAALLLWQHAASPGPAVGAARSLPDDDPVPPELHAAQALEWERTAAMVTHTAIRRMDAARAAAEWEAAAEGFDREGRASDAAQARQKAQAVSR